MGSSQGQLGLMLFSCDSFGMSQHWGQGEAEAEQKSGSGWTLEMWFLHQMTPPCIQKGMFGWRMSLFLGFGGFSCFYWWVGALTAHPRAQSCSCCWTSSSPSVSWHWGSFVCAMCIIHPLASSWAFFSIFEKIWMSWIAQEEERDPKMPREIFPGSTYWKPHSSLSCCAGKERNNDLRICLIEECDLIQDWGCAASVRCSPHLPIVMATVGKAVPVSLIPALNLLRLLQIEQQPFPVPAVAHG